MAFHEGMGSDKRDVVARWNAKRLPGAVENAEDSELGPEARYLGVDRPEDNTVLESVRPSRRTKSSGKGGHFGIGSKSEMLYPEAYRPVSRAFWEGLSAQQQHEVMRLQAVAQEKVGFERGAPKYFIDDFNPDGRPQSPDVSLVEMATPRLISGGFLLGAGAFSAVLALLGVLPMSEGLIGGLTAIAVGGALAFMTQS
jgi:hypothetical protein